MSLEKLFAEVFSLPEAAVDDSLLFPDIETWDSLSHMLLIERLESHYAVMLSGDQIADMRSVSDARQALRSHGVVV